MAYHNNNPYYDSWAGSSDHRRFESAKSRENNHYPEDSSERSFELGVDPIERDWGDSRSQCRSSLRETPLGTSSQNSNGSSIPTYTTQERNAMYKPRRPKYDDEFEDCNESACSFYEERTQDTLSLTTASLSSRSPEQQGRDQRARYSRLDQQQEHENGRHHLGMRRTPTRRDHRLRGMNSPSPVFSPRSSNGSSGAGAMSSDGSVRSRGSFCSRSAPERRTRIAREPSMYSVNSGNLCNISRRSLTFDSRSSLAFDRRRGGNGGGDRRNTQWKSQVREGPTTSPIPIVHIDLDVVQVDTGRNERPKGQINLQSDLVDIAPGVKASLRGAQETVKAVAKDYYANVSCFGCSLELCCIADVSYVVCPVCKVVSPMDTPTFEGKEINRHGLGLGFTYDDLFKMQLEIIEDRKRGRS